MIKKLNYPYYAIAGANGIAIVNNFNRAIKLNRYISSTQICCCHSFDHAERWALTKFHQSSPHAHYRAKYEKLLCGHC